MKKIATSELHSLLAAIARNRKLYIPVDDASGQSQFTLWKNGMPLSKALNTIRSAKDFRWKISWASRLRISRLN